MHVQAIEEERAVDDVDLRHREQATDRRLDLHRHDGMSRSVVEEGEADVSGCPSHSYTPMA